MPELILEDNRIKVIETRVTKQILSEPEEYNRDLNEKEKEAVLKAMIQSQEKEAAKAEEEADSSVGRITSRMDSKQATQKFDGAAHDTFNILP